MNGTLNKVMLIGHLGDDVKMHYFEGGNCIGRFPLATNEVYVNKQTNERVTSTEWHNIVVRNKAAEVCEKYLNKGDKIYVEGRIKSRQWQGEDGITRYTTEIQVTEFTFLTTKNDVEPNAAQPQQQQPQQPQQSQQNSSNQPAQEQSANYNVNAPEPDDDLPF